MIVFPRSESLVKHESVFAYGILVLLIFIGFGLRVIGTDWGFPFLVHPDEFLVVDPTYDMIERQSFAPRAYIRPNHISIYVNSIAFQLASSIKFGKPTVETFSANITYYYLISRLMVALFGTLMILVAYFIGNEYKREVGIIVAAVFAFFPSYVQHSHYATPDIPVTLFLMFVVLFLVRYIKNPTILNLMLSNFFCAISVSEKYPAIIAFSMVVVCIAVVNFRDGRKLIMDSFIASTFFLFSLFLISPTIFIHFDDVVRSIKGEARPYHPGADGLNWLGNLNFYAREYFYLSGFMMLVFLIFGFIQIIKDQKSASVPVFFGFAYWIVLSGLSLHWERWALPMYTSTLILSAYGAFTLYFWLKNSRRKLFLAVYSLFAVITVLNMVASSFSIMLSFTAADTRIVSHAFCTENGINKNNAIWEPYTPFDPRGGIPVFETALTGEDSKKYLILSDYYYARYLAEPHRYKKENAFYARAFELPLIKEFKPDRSYRNNSFYELSRIKACTNYFVRFFTNKKEIMQGPIIRIYRIPDKF